MIERLLAADAAFQRGDLEVAERLFAQVAGADARNAIAVVGLARLALARGDRGVARSMALKALDIDPDEAAARRLLHELDHQPPEPEIALPEPKPPHQRAARTPSLFARIRRWLRGSRDRG